LNELQHRFTPKELMNSVAEHLLGQEGVVTNLKNSVRTNPLPYCLLGIGSGLLIASMVKARKLAPARGLPISDSGPDAYQSLLSAAMNDEEISPDNRPESVIQSQNTQQFRQSNPHAGQFDNERGAENSSGPQMAEADQQKENAAHFGKAKEKLTSLAKNTKQVGHTLKENSRQFANKLKQKAQNTSQQVSSYAVQNPLGLIAIGSGLGVFLGSIIPQSQKETQLMNAVQEKLQVQPLQSARQNKDQVAEDYESRQTLNSEKASDRLKNSPTELSH
jgi:ElaB/YqjD/DUF883 family membrane-anchored ribosome-binding protein